MPATLVILATWIILDMGVIDANLIRGYCRGKRRLPLWAHCDAPLQTILKTMTYYTETVWNHSSVLIRPASKPTIGSKLSSVRALLMSARECFTSPGRGASNIGATEVPIIL